MKRIMRLYPEDLNAEILIGDLEGPRPSHSLGVPAKVKLDPPRKVKISDAIAQGLVDTGYDQGKLVSISWEDHID